MKLISLMPDAAGQSILRLLHKAAGVAEANSRHALEMARGARKGSVLYAGQVPLLPETRDLAEQKVYPGGTIRNMDWVKEDVLYEAGVSDIDKVILCDAVTSGGLLFAVPAEEADALMADLQVNGIVDAMIVGDVVAEHPGQIRVKP